MTAEPVKTDRSAWQQEAPAGSIATAVGRAPVRRLMGVQVAGLGQLRPRRDRDQRAVGHAWAATPIGSCSGPASASGGFSPELATSDMALAAARRCLARSEIAADEIDLLVVGTFTPDVTVPSVACLVQHQLGISAPAMDLQAACAGFVYALVTAAQFVAAGTSRWRWSSEPIAIREFSTVAT